jgi:acyl-CoA thioester hydrolase
VSARITLEKEFPVIVTIPVIWGDQDAMGHVNNTVFLRWFESARVALMERLSIDHDGKTSSQAPILASTTCNFHQQVLYPDTIQTGVTVDRIGNTSLTLRHAIVSSTSSTVVAEGTSVIVMFDYQSQKPTPVTDVLRAAISELLA